MEYISFLYKDSDIGYEDKGNGYNIIIPDVDGAYSCGDDFIHSVKMAKEVLEVCLEDTIDLPKANTMEYFTDERLEELDIPTNAIPQVVEYLIPKKKRITVNLNLSALNIIDNFMKSHNLKNRSAFLEQSALKVA
ncbi:MAG: type II toxin-antitoxin system HicB family antitoxin, partial [Campylobacterota bacterium]|nr:type II toxin-antitoxin system HicB family antitoxin [Campylobacterota bacterium]